ncbi:MAG TPA: hypothetical protein VMO17_03480 [Terriglobia bacterium]|nr:hypothetical protein [Terriglobia bacterium]
MNSNSLQIQALITFLAPFVIQVAKRSQNSAFAWIDQNKPKVCMLTSGVAAVLTSMGIEFVHAPHSLTVTWPDSATLARGLVTFVVSAVLQFAAQHALYDGFWRHVVPSPHGGPANS